LKNNNFHYTAEVSDKSFIGENTKIWHHVQVLDNASIGKNCNIGKSVYIDDGVSIGDRVKVQNGVSIYRGVSIESDCFIGPNAVFTNDLYPRSFSIEFSVIPTLIKKGASIGANATIVCGNTIGEYAMVGAGAVVITDVPAYALVVGNPAKIIKYLCKCGQPISDSGVCNTCEESP
jgi:UDP-2-acetamido-3-amino-2,3-dideoxy-glucuronate N-acetyltransferase